MSSLTETKKRKPLLIKSGSSLAKKEELTTLNANQSEKKLEFIDSMAAQLSKIDFLNAKYLPLHAIQLDVDNPRELSIDIADVANGPRLSEGSFDDEKQDEFKEILKQHFGSEDNKKQKIQDYLSIALLASTIKSPEQLMQPICVYEKGNKYTVLAGERRTLAHHVMGAKYIAANIIKEPESKEKALLQYIENSAREDLSLKDKFKAIKKIIMIYGETISVRSLASILRLSKSQAQKYAKICKEENLLFRKAIEAGVITSPEDAYNIIKNNDPNTISNICNLLLKGKGIEEVLQEINYHTPHLANVKIKRVISSSALLAENNEYKDNKQKFVLKGEDLTILKELIHIAFKAGKIELSKEDFKQGEMEVTELWSKIKEQMVGMSTLR